MPAAAEWRQRPERGTARAMRTMVALSIALGRAPSRVILCTGMLYFLFSSGKARRNIRAYLTRILARPPSLAEEYRLLLAFASTIHDRIYFLRGRFDLFDIEVKGAQVFDSEGALLMGGHVGSFEVLRACGRELGKRRVAMAMYEESPQLKSALEAVNPQVAADIIALGRPQSMLELAACLEDGALVGMLADRTLLGDEPTMQVPFLGSEAAFPTGPMRIAAALRRRVIFMAGLYMGGNRYQIRFEPLADFTQLDTMNREARDAAIREGVVQYARRLEQATRDAPSNWFNFHDFWGAAA